MTKWKEENECVVLLDTFLKLTFEQQTEIARDEVLWYIKVFGFYSPIANLNAITGPIRSVEIKSRIKKLEICLENSLTSLVREFRESNMLAFNFFGRVYVLGDKNVTQDFLCLNDNTQTTIMLSELQMSCNTFDGLYFPRLTCEDIAEVYWGKETALKVRQIEETRKKVFFKYGAAASAEVSIDELSNRNSLLLKQKNLTSQDEKNNGII